MTEPRAKYIVIETDHLPPTPVVFPVWLYHSVVFGGLAGFDTRVIGAGFVEFGSRTQAAYNYNGDYNGEESVLTVLCVGRSDSLDIDSRGEEDATVIRKTLGVGW